jgi:hypothetical protein
MADASAMTMRRRVEEFLRFAKELAVLGISRDAANDDENYEDPLTEYLNAIAIYVSPKKAGEDDDKDASVEPSEGAYRVLPTVRMARVALSAGLGTAPP